MLINITNHFTADGKEYFRWELYDGPDGIEEVKGYAIDLIQAFAKIIEWREKIGLEYLPENDKTNWRTTERI